MNSEDPGKAVKEVNNKEEMPAPVNIQDEQLTERKGTDSDDEPIVAHVENSEAQRTY